MQDVQMDSDVADRRRRQQLIATTLDALALERSKVLICTLLVFSFSVLSSLVLGDTQSLCALYTSPHRNCFTLIRNPS